MGSFDIVLVLLPESGKASAASAASNFRSSFSNITLALLVGVCGGVPYTKDNEEILLGDVVISKTVVQYDLGGQYSGNFLTKETLENRLGRPGRNIRSIVTLMESNHGRERLESRATVLLEQLQRHANRKKTRKPVNYEYPGILKDRLFDSNYVHKHQVLLPHRCCEEFPCDRSHILSCDDLGCEDEYLVQRQRLNSQCQNLSIFIGRFGSGDMILKAGTYRDHIAQCHGILAFEMEAAGIWDELPCIIVKGISNYADGHWNAGSNWQQFAAATAAATARALLERYPKTDKPRSPMAVVENRKERTKEEDECLRDMRTTDSSLDKKRIEDTNGGLLRDSYIWILSNAEFIQWRHNSDGGLLWIKGDPGKGKTMLICGLIDELQTNRLTNLHYFFCQASDSRLNSATKVLCSLVYSIACQDQEALSLVMEKYRHAGRELFHNTNSWTAMSQVMNQILRKANLKDSVFIIDGLDECVTDLALLLDFITQAPEHAEAKWIVSSRNWPSIEEKLNTSSKKLLLSLELNEQSISDAVHIYIKHKVDQLATIKKLDEHSRDVVQAHLSSNANGTFLWVALVYKELFKVGVKKRHLQNLMTAFPPGLGPLYARMMEQVCESRDKGVCVQVLELISLTYRPISLVELASLVEILDDDDDFDELRDIIATCGSFLVLKDDVIYFVHQSAKDFLLSNTSDQIFASGIALKHHDIFSRSIQALSQSLRRDIYKLCHPGALPLVPSPDPLAPLQYACVYWVDHLRDTAINSAGKTVLQASLHNEGTVHSFLKFYLLCWLEALCLMGKLSEGILAIRTLKALTTQDRGQLHMFTSDALQVVLMFRSAIEYTPLQLYSSALLFTPTSSTIRNTFEPIHTTKWITQKPSVQPEWDACLQTLEGHKQAICSLVFSPDNTKLASASIDGNVRVWDRATGACLGPLTSSGRSRVTSMAFSPDGSQLALAQDASVKILDISANACVMTFNMRPYMDETQIMFSPNGMQLILSNKFWEAGKFQIWDLNTRMRLQEEDYYRDIRQPAIYQIDVPDEREIPATYNIRSPVTGSCVQVTSDESIWKVLFSLDGMQFALGLAGGMMVRRPAVYVLDVTGQRCRYLQMPTYGLDSDTGKRLHEFEDVDLVDFIIALSPDGTRLAAPRRGSIHIWDVKTDTRLSMFSSHIGYCTYMAFSPDGTELAFAEEDRCIRIWDLTPGAPVNSEEERSIISVTYSPDGTRFALVIGSRFGNPAITIEIWDHIEGKKRNSSGLISGVLSMTIYQERN
ncbi:WD40 repeat-like protein [Trichoderma austrokoningii]